MSNAAALRHQTHISSTQSESATARNDGVVGTEHVFALSVKVHGASELTRRSADRNAGWWKPCPQSNSVFVQFVQCEVQPTVQLHTTQNDSFRSSQGGSLQQ